MGFSTWMVPSKPFGTYHIHTCTSLQHNLTSNPSLDTNNQNRAIVSYRYSTPLISPPFVSLRLAIRSWIDTPLGWFYGLTNFSFLFSFHPKFRGVCELVEVHNFSPKFIRLFVALEHCRLVTKDLSQSLIYSPSTITHEGCKRDPKKKIYDTAKSGTNRIRPIDDMAECRTCPIHHRYPRPALLTTWPIDRPHPSSMSTAAFIGR